MSAPGGRSLAIALSVVVTLVIAVGLYLAGSPATARQEALDRRRVDDLHVIALQVKLYRTTHGALPPSLAAVDSASRIAPVSRDPVTGEPYGYEILSDSTVALCATFALPSEPDIRPDRDAHPAGRYCFPDLLSATR